MKWQNVVLRTSIFFLCINFKIECATLRSINVPVPAKPGALNQKQQIQGIRIPTPSIQHDAGTEKTVPPEIPDTPHASKFAIALLKDALREGIEVSVKEHQVETEETYHNATQVKNVFLGYPPAAPVYAWWAPFSGDLAPTEVVDMCGGTPGVTKWIEITESCANWSVTMLKCMMACNFYNRFLGYGGCMDRCGHKKLVAAECPMFCGVGVVSKIVSDHCDHHCKKWDECQCSNKDHQSADDWMACIHTCVYDCNSSQQLELNLGFDVSWRDRKCLKKMYACGGNESRSCMHIEHCAFGIWSKDCVEMTCKPPIGNGHTTCWKDDPFCGGRDAAPNPDGKFLDQCQFDRKEGEYCEKYLLWNKATSFPKCAKPLECKMEDGKCAPGPPLVPCPPKAPAPAPAPAKFICKEAPIALICGLTLEGRATEKKRVPSKHEYPDPRVYSDFCCNVLKDFGSWSPWEECISQTEKFCGPMNGVQKRTRTCRNGTIDFCSPHEKISKQPCDLPACPECTRWGPIPIPIEPAGDCLIIDAMQASNETAIQAKDLPALPPVFDLSAVWPQNQTAEPPREKMIFLKPNTTCALSCKNPEKFILKEFVQPGGVLESRNLTCNAQGVYNYPPEVLRCLLKTPQTEAEVVHEWSDWGTCMCPQERPCGEGRQFREKTCTPPAPNCNEDGKEIEEKVCKKECHLARGPGDEHCHDHEESCNFWALHQNCGHGEYGDYMEINCPMSCKYCTPEFKEYADNRR